MELKRNYKTEFEVAKVFFQILKHINKLPLKNRELDVLAYISSYGFDEKKIAEQVGTTINTINNCVSKLCRAGYINKKREITPILKQDYTNLKLEVTLGKEA